MCPRNVGTEGDELVDLSGHVGTGIQTLISGVDYKTVVAQETYRSVVLGLLVTT